MPKDYHPLADTMSDDHLKEWLAKIKATKMQPLDQIPSHDKFLEAFCKAG
jgi:tryptophan halogenase